ncbi:MAG: type II toxin-antitoxin system Phd/YefM family antitoxin [Bythopirellula sp.]|nr:type II toxin-antitoxin system Phd/YefM family antitoxin [Bythopirellula sp.]
MAIKVTFSEARSNLADLLDIATDTREIVLIDRVDKRPVALISAHDLHTLIAVVHLLRSPKNAMRLHSAIERVRPTQTVLESLPQL